MSSARITGSPLTGRLGSVGSAGPGIATPAVPSAPVVSRPLAAIRYQSTWPRGWMAAAVPQQVREFHTQVSKAQMALEFLSAMQAELSALVAVQRQQRKLPSEAGVQRVRAALQSVQALWEQRWQQTLASLDETAHWSPVFAARKTFSLVGWNWETLQAAHAQDTELVSFCLMGQDGAQGAWQASHARSRNANRQALATTLALQGVELGKLDQPMLLSVPEQAWSTLVQRFMVKGNGQRFPAGQWVAPRLQTGPQTLPLPGWSAADTDALETLYAAVPLVQQQLTQVQIKIQAFQDNAAHSLENTAQQVAGMQAFAQAFAQAGQAPAYDWVLAVVPAVRAISRRRVARLLQSRGVLG